MATKKQRSKRNKKKREAKKPDIMTQAQAARAFTDAVTPNRHPDRDALVMASFLHIFHPDMSPDRIRELANSQRKPAG